MASVTRRRFLTILAGTSAALATRAHAAPALHSWTGVALGAEASLQLAHTDATKARALIDECVAELKRLEAILSLYEPGSALSVLNRAGRLDDAPAELVAVLTEAKAYGDLSGGAFDVTVQPLWRLYADHFARADADPAGPSPAAIAAKRALVDYRAIRIDGHTIRLGAGQKVTLNGIAQGWITDRVTELLKAKGLDSVLVDFGEQRALGGHPDGRPWRLGIADPKAPERLRSSVAISNRAAATSAGYGMAFDAAGRFTHILNPGNGIPANSWASVTVVADTATTADALSTLLNVTPPERAAELVSKGGTSVEAILIRHDGALVRV